MSNKKSIDFQKLESELNELKKLKEKHAVN